MSGRDVKFAAVVVAAALLIGTFGHGNAAELLTTDQIIERLNPMRARGLKVIEVVKPSVALPMIQFEFDSYWLTPEAARQLDYLAGALRSEQPRKYAFLIEGHTDGSGSRSYNQILSERRAAAVLNYLERRYGIDPTRLKSVGLGEDRPLIADDPENGRNRRVEIVNLGE